MNVQVGSLVSIAKRITNYVQIAIRSRSFPFDTSPVLPWFERVRPPVYPGSHPNDSLDATRFENESAIGSNVKGLARFKRRNTRMKQKQITENRRSRPEEHSDVRVSTEKC